MKMFAPIFIPPTQSDQPFPDVEFALTEPDGLLAIGADLSPDRLIEAYSKGIFPWYNEGQPILWWSPNPRLVLFPDKLRISRSLGKTLRKNIFSMTIDHAFTDVIDACALPRRGQPGTWITPQMRNAYLQLHELGIAHSVEARQNGQIVGGLYGVAIGQVFYGESMFSFKTDASKVAFVWLVEKLRNWGYQLIDCQVKTKHLMQFGAEEIPRAQFTESLSHLTPKPPAPDAWQIRT
jgi:leucyl/phenylalanyl-tRNA--protein transferase